MNTENLYKTIGLAGILAVSSCSSCSERSPQVQERQPVQPAPVVQQPQPREYVVRTGDYPSGIVARELGLRGREIYNALPAIQARSNLGPERDTHMMVDGELISGQDGYVDLIYPGERIRLR